MEHGPVVPVRLCGGDALVATICYRDMTRVVMKPASGCHAPEPGTAKHDVMVSNELIVDGIFNDNSVQDVLSRIVGERRMSVRACYVRRMGAVPVTEGENTSTQQVEKNDGALHMCKNGVM